MTYIPTDLNTLQFLRTYDPNRGRKGFGGGQIKVTPKDNCPDGDTSPTEYDSLCSGMSA